MAFKRLWVNFLLLLKFHVPFCSTKQTSFEKDIIDGTNPVKCLDTSIRYRRRPEPTMFIETQVAILAIDSISSSRMELSSEIYLFHEWYDYNCMWRPLPRQGNMLTLYERPGEGSVWTHKGLNNLWQPDTQVFNAKIMKRPETVTHIFSTGKVKQRIRLSVVTSCPMNLKLYPMDRQHCDLIFQSSAHNLEEIVYEWQNLSKLTFVQGLHHQDKMTPDLKILGFKVKFCCTLLKNGLLLLI